MLINMILKLRIRSNLQGCLHLDKSRQTIKLPGELKSALLHGCEPRLREDLNT